MRATRGRCLRTRPPGGARDGLPIDRRRSVRTTGGSVWHRRGVGYPHTVDCFCPVVRRRSLFADGNPIRRCAGREYRDRFAIMVPPPSAVPPPLPSLTLSQIQAWDTD